MDIASDPSLTPFDHAIYDLQLLDCKKSLIKLLFTKPIDIKFGINKFFMI